MKKGMNKGSAKRVVIILSLCLALLIALGAFSFAWIRNYVDVDNLEVKTGKMLYNFKLYRVNGDKVTSVNFFDTNTPEDFEAGNTEAKLEKNLAANPLINIEDGEEVFFVIEKYADSIDFDVAISFDNDGRPENFENIGQMNYALANDTDAALSIDSQAALEAYLKAPGENPATTENLSNIWNRVQEAYLRDTQKYAVVRLKIAKNSGVSADLEDRSFPFRISFCVAQKDALPDNEKTDKFYVKDHTQLEDVMNKYGFGDEIYITKSFTYSGDLVFTRPCTITLVRSTLTINGNLVFSYMYGNKFELNTVSDGHIKILKREGVDGNFQIDLPNTTIELLGANNDAIGMADIYVEGSFTANTSKNAGEGLFFSGSRICNVTLDQSNNYVYSDSLKPILINGATRISISNRTRVGSLSVSSNCRRFILENSGYIEKLDLRSMTQDVTLLSTPAILIDNAGTIGTVSRGANDTPKAEDGDVILLPEWSIKFNKEDIKSAEDNTHIIANQGSGKILAITKYNTFEDSPAVVNGGKYFFSLGNNDNSTYRDDVDYMLRTQFVEAVNGDKTKVVIHYETPSPNILRESQYKELESLTTLKSYIDYYSAKGVIASAEELKEVTVICYGNKALTAPPLKNPAKPEQGYAVGLEYDYNFIKSMSALTKLDLSDAVSVDKKVPDNAFKGMSNLTSVQMSESDTFWGKYIFTGTGVDEITFPQSLTTLDNPIDSYNRVNKQESLDGIRYVYTSITIVDGIYANKAAVQYYFVPDDFTCEEYRKKNTFNETEWHARIFLNNGVKRYGEYFLRYDPNSNEVVPTCEFVVFTGGVDLVKDKSGNIIESKKPWVKKEDFDFNNMYVDGKVYKINSFDPYALFNKLYSEDPFSLVLDTNVKSIGKYAFACGSGISTANGLASVHIKGNPEILGNAFAYNDALVEFNAPELTAFKGGYNLSNNNVLKTVYTPKLSVVDGVADLGNCPELQRVDISVIERDDINKNFYIAIKVDSKDQNKIYNDVSAYEDYSYAKFYIHTEYANDASTYTNALAADNRHIFVNENYANLYSSTEAYTGVTDMGENPLSALIAADEDGNDLTEGKQPAYYYVIDGSSAKLVACLLPQISEAGKDYTTISSFKHDGITYPVTHIGSAAYHFTFMIAQNIKIGDGIKEIGSYAFYSYEKSDFKKYCIILDLNDVVKAGSYAFYYNDMAKIVGDKLEEVGAGTFSYNTNLRLANLPNLIRSRPAGSTDSKPRVFVSCENLRLAYIGYSDDIAYDQAYSLKKNYIRFINFVSGSEKIDLPKVNTVINSSYPTVADTKYFTTSLVKTDKSFNGIYLSDYYNHEVNIMGLSGIIELPGYVYSMQKNGELSLIAVSPDLQVFGDYKTNAKGGSDYTTPGKLYASGGRYTAKDNGTDAKFTVTSFGNHAYGAVIVEGVDNFIVADTIKVLNYGALSGSAYENSNSSIVTLFGINCLDLTNVTTLGKQACRGAKMIELKAPSAAVFGTEAFLNCTALTKAYLPAFKTSDSDTFENCGELIEVTLGENAEKLGSSMFTGAKALQKITILSHKKVELGGSSLIDSDYVNNVTVAVPQSIINEYTKSGTFGNIPTKNFTYFENASTLGSATYYWNVLDEAAKTAYIDYVEGTLSATLVFPSEFDGYKVVAISPNAISSLSDDVTKIVLPDNMEYLTFNTSDLTTGITALEIADSNSKFKTVDGVLYSEDGKVLYIYPKSKESTDFIVNATVTEIAYRAFYQDEKQVSALETLTIAGVVTIRDQAFENSSIGLIKFTSTTASVFAGKDILLGANSLLRISVPNASLGAFKSNVLMDYSILGRFIGA